MKTDRRWCRSQNTYKGLKQELKTQDLRVKLSSQNTYKGLKLSIGTAGSVASSVFAEYL